MNRRAAEARATGLLDEADILLARPAFKGRRVRDIEHTQCYLCEWAETIELCDKRPSYTLVRACEHHRERP